MPISSLHAAAQPIDGHRSSGRDVHHPACAATLKERLERAETIIAIQKKVSEILGIPLKTDKPDGSDS
jgi:hypothetical protein